MSNKIVKKYPSRVKYEKQNPSITLRVPLEFKIKIDKMVETSGKSISKIVYNLLSDDEKNFTDTFKRFEKDIFDKGYQKGQKDWAIWFYCSTCKKGIYIHPNSNVHKALINYMEEHGWSHGECINKTTPAK